MARVTDAMRAMLGTQKRAMKTGMVINKKTFTKMRFRIIPPPEGMTPGVENIKIFVNQLEKGTTSPAAWGYPCPVMDALEVFRRGASKDAKEEMYNSVRVTREYWFPGIDQEDPGTAENPTIQIFPSPQRIYQQIIEQLIGDGKDEDDESNDITDVHEGQDVRIRKEGSGKDTQWHAKFLNPSPISEDEDYVAAIVELAKNFNVKDHFFKVDLDVLQSAYTLITGKEEIPEKYMEGIHACGKDAPAGTEDADDDDAPKSKTLSSKKLPPADKPVAKKAGIVQGGLKKTPTIIIDETRVLFDGAEGETEGLVTGEGKDDEGASVYEVTDDDGEAWTVPKNLVKVVPAKAEKKAKDEDDDDADDADEDGDVDAADVEDVKEKDEDDDADDADDDDGEEDEPEEVKPKKVESKPKPTAVKAGSLKPVAAKTGGLKPAEKTNVPVKAGIKPGTGSMSARIGAAKKAVKK